MLRCNLNVESAFAIICMSRPGIGANEESSTLQETRSSKSGEERGEKCKEGEDVRGGDGDGRRASVRKSSLTRRQSRDLLKKKISVEEQVPLADYPAVSFSLYANKLSWVSN